MQQSLIQVNPDAAGAIFSEDRKYRYLLWRRWGAGNRMMCFCGLNPSIASELRLDPTCTRFMVRARDGGFDGFFVINAFSLVSTDPDGLLSESDPIGPDNDHHILETAKKCEMFVACWGSASPLIKARAAKVTAMLIGAGIQMHAIEINGDGQPCHLLYKSFEKKPFAWSPA